MNLMGILTVSLAILKTIFLAVAICTFLLFYNQRF